MEGLIFCLFRSFWGFSAIDYIGESFFIGEEGGWAFEFLSVSDRDCSGVRVWVAEGFEASSLEVGFGIINHKQFVTKALPYLKRKKLN